MFCWIVKKSNENTTNKQLDEQIRTNTIEYYSLKYSGVVAVIKF